MESEQEEMNLLRKQLSISINRVEMLVTHRSTAEQEEKMKKRGTRQTLTNILTLCTLTKSLRLRREK